MKQSIVPPMDAIYGVTKEQLAEMTSKYSELKAQFGQEQAEGEFDRYLASKGLDQHVWANAHNGWLERFRADPTGRAEAEFHMLLQQLSQKAHFGDVRDMSQDRIEGITLDQYAQITVAVSREGADADAIVRNFGLQDVAHWQRANAAWGAAMGADTTFKLSTQFGQLYQKYAGPQFQQEMVSQTAAILADANKPQDVVDEPEEELTPDLCLQKMQSPSRNERWKYARLYANMVDLGNVPNKAQGIANVTPHLVSMIEDHDEHTTSDAEQAVNQLWDLGVRNDEIPGAIGRCLNRAKEKLATLQAAFAPIQNQAVPERVTLQSRIQDYTSLVDTMQDYAGREWTGPAMHAAQAAPAGVAAPSFPGSPAFAAPSLPSMGSMPSGGFPKWILAPIVLVLALGGVFAMRARAKSAEPTPAASAAAPASAATTTAASAKPAETAPAAAAAPVKSATPAPAKAGAAPAKKKH